LLPNVSAYTWVPQAQLWPHTDLLPHNRNSRYREAARAIAEEIARMPSPEEVSSHLAGWAAGRGG
jgi:hypothetical protein